MTNTSKVGIWASGHVLVLVGNIKKIKKMIEVIAIVISIIALIFSLLKDFIIPYFRKPKLKFEYKSDVPFRRFTTSHTRSCFLRIRVKNIGKTPALNCRCQILSIEKDNEPYGDYIGFPVRWASRLAKDVTPLDRERLEIGQGECEFLDTATANYCDEKIHLCQYHNEGIGIPIELEPNDYNVVIIVSGSNFKPYVLSFKITKMNTNNPDGLKGIELNVLKNKYRNKYLE